MNAIQHKPSARQIANERWGIPEPEAPASPQSKNILPRRERGFWQGIQNLPVSFQLMEIRKSRAHITCRRCWDTGAIAVPDPFGDVEWEPCECQNNVPAAPYDDVPF